MTKNAFKEYTFGEMLLRIKVTGRPKLTFQYSPSSISLKNLPNGNFFHAQCPHGIRIPLVRPIALIEKSIAYALL